MYIAIEGIKGSGKTTLISMISEALREQKRDFTVLRHTARISCPSVYEFLNDRIKMLRNYDCWNSLLYSRRAQYSHNNIHDARLIIGDRSVATSYAVRWRKWGDPVKCIHYVDKTEKALRVPDHIIMLDTFPEVAFERINQRIKTDTVKADETISRLELVRSNYFEVMGYRPGRLSGTDWTVLDGNREIKNVFEDLSEILNNLNGELIL